MNILNKNNWKTQATIEREIAKKRALVIESNSPLENFDKFANIHTFGALYAQSGLDVACLESQGAHFKFSQNIRGMKGLELI